jgi:hypothetical protein
MHRSRDDYLVSSGRVEGIVISIFIAILFYLVYRVVTHGQ